MSMRIVLGADHGGFDLKKELVEGLRDLKYIVDDLGTFNADPSDFADFAHGAVQYLLSNRADRAILVDGTGVGMSMTANRYPGIRAANCSDVFTARYSRAHADSNVLTLGARVIGVGLAWEIVNVWLSTEFGGGDRHMRRIAKIERS